MADVRQQGNSTQNQNPQQRFGSDARQESEAQRHASRADDREQGYGRAERNGEPGNGAQSNGMQRNGAPFPNVAAVALRGTALLFDLQLEAARSVWQAQARTAAMLGMPDFSNLFRVGDDRARNLFSASTEQVVGTLRHATQTMTTLQREMGRLAEQHTIGLTDQMREQLAQLGRQTERGLQELQRMTQDEAHELGEASQRYDRGAQGDDAQRRDWPQGQGMHGAGGDDGHGVEGATRRIEHAAREGEGAERPEHRAGARGEDGTDQRHTGGEERHGRARAKA